MSARQHRYNFYSLSSLETLSTGDGKDAVGIEEAHEEVVSVTFTVDDNGSTSGATTINLRRVRDGVADADLFASGDRPSIAHDSSSNKQELFADVLQNQFLEHGDQLQLDIDAIPGSASSFANAVVKTRIIEEHEAA